MLDIVKRGIVQVLEDGAVRIVRPGKNGGQPTVVSVPSELAEEHRLATGDIVDGDIQPIPDFADYLEATDCQLMSSEEDVDLQYDEPIRPQRVSEFARPRQLVSTEALLSVGSVNGLTLAEAQERPFPKSRRNQSERTRSERLLTLAAGPSDTLGRMLDFCAPLGCGDFGAIVGPHNSGLTRTMRSIVEGITTNAPDCVVIAVMIQARGEEVTDFRRRFPTVDILVCPTGSFEVSRDVALLIPTLILETAQRQTEMGKDVVLAIDSLTALWGMMLESEEATDQREADLSQARQRIREYVQKSGCFHGESPLGGSLGGSLTIIGAVWSQPIDVEAEDDRETHPHLRLMEQIIPDLSWRVTLDPELAAKRLYPAIDAKACLSRNESTLLDPNLLEAVLSARGALPRSEPITCYNRLMDALDEPGDLSTVCERIVQQ